MKKLILILSLFAFTASAQLSSTFSVSSTFTTSFVFSKGIEWVESNHQDSIKNIIIEGDTMTAIRNLLIYCLQVKRENEYAKTLWQMVNIDKINELYGSEDFDFYVKKYKKILAQNKKYKYQKFTGYK